MTDIPNDLLPAFSPDREKGLTKLEYFTAVALQGLLAGNTMPLNRYPDEAITMATRVCALLDELD